ncbi:hypothetical protein RFI_01896 [Reticulomyxa filosa]|uniref:Calponin-homology (CH) domain-containing protein n=1 Tax=Reticulomyxa filosa TaxID=46433 RepID=X6PAL9_RETFI|nr:hypothetical protein RFI_01896 [Reticulomyxa filosa]|eukprot:ETO35178.1 hypothetical protein RFI_01896 [Reticulomyxa filosa]
MYMKGDSMNGILLLKILDRIHPGCVNWMKVKVAPKNKWDYVLNCNLVIGIISKEPYDLKTTNIGGVDIAEGKLKAILSVAGQIQRYFMIKTLKELKFADKYVTDDQIRDWSNSITLQSPYRFSQPIKKWNERSLSTGLYFFDLLAVLDTTKTLIDPLQVYTDFTLNEDMGIDEGVLIEKKISNISAVITLTRKLGGILFVHIQDLIEAKSQGTLTIVATILAVGLRMGNFSRSFEQRMSTYPKDSYQSRYTKTLTEKLEITQERPRDSTNSRNDGNPIINIDNDNDKKEAEE